MHGCQGNGEDEEPAQRQHLAVGARQVHEQTIPHAGMVDNMESDFAVFNKNNLIFLYKIELFISELGENRIV